MSERKYTYDVAFSFLNDDLGLAQQLDQHLQDTMKTFVYANRQEELIGTDGADRFTQIFGQQARTVVVLYREMWGKTRWTRVEERAIKDRAFEEGCDFLSVFPLDDPPGKPVWLPKTRLWGDIRQTGVRGAAAVIEARVRSAGGEVRPQSPGEQASRISEQIGFAKRRNEFLNSEIGVKLANAAADALRAKTQELAESITGTEEAMTIEYRQHNPRIWEVFSYGWHLRFLWQSTCVNSLREAFLEVVLSRDPNPFSQQPALQPWRGRFSFDLCPTGDPLWRDEDPDPGWHTCEKLADYLFRKFLDNFGPDRIRAEAPT